MNIRDIKQGDRLFVKSLHNTTKHHGINDSMKRKLGKLITVDAVNYDSISAIGYTWNAHDLSVDDPKEIKTVKLTGKVVKFNPETL